MSEIDKIKVKVLESLLDEIKNMHSEYIMEYISDQIEIIKHGI